MPDPCHFDPESFVLRCRAGDAQAWTALVQRYQRLVYAVARRAGCDEHAAADVFQTVFTRLVEHLPRIRQPENLQAWLVTTAKREALRERRGMARTVSMTQHDDDGGPAFEETVADDSPLAEAALDLLQQLDLVRHGIDQLDARCRELLLLLFRDEDERVAYEEVARRLSIPVGSIGPTRARCLAKLRQLVVPD